MQLVNSQLFENPLSTKEFSLDENLAIVDFPAIARGEASPRANDFLGYGGLSQQFGDLGGQFSEVEFRSIVSLGDIRLYLRRGAPGNVTGVRALFSPPTPISYDFFKSDVLDPIFPTTIPFIPHPGDILRSDVSGDQIRFLINGVVIDRRVDSDLAAFITKGKPGFAMYADATPGPPSGVSIGSWKGGSLEAEARLQKSDGSSFDNFLNPICSRELVKRGHCEIIVPGKSGFDVIRLKTEHQETYEAATPNSPVVVGVSDITFRPVLYPQN